MFGLVFLDSFHQEDKSCSSSMSNFSNPSSKDTGDNDEDEGSGHVTLCHHRGDCVTHAGRGFVRGFGIGFGMRGMLSLIPGLLFRKGYLRPGKLLKGSLLSKGTLGFAMFLGSYIGGFKALLCLLRKLRNKDDPLNAAIAGGLAGTSLLFADSSEVVTWALYLLLRAAETIFYALVRRGKIKPIPHGDSLLFSLSTAIIFAAYINTPLTVRPSYRKFLRNMNGGHELSTMPKVTDKM